MDVADMFNELCAKAEELDADVKECADALALVQDELDDGAIPEACGGSGPMSADRRARLMAQKARLEKTLDLLRKELAEVNEKINAELRLLADDGPVPI
jgi:hypothetical protein